MSCGKRYHPQNISISHTVSGYDSIVFVKHPVKLSFNTGLFLPFVIYTVIVLI